MRIRRCRAALGVLSGVVVLGLGSAASANHVPALELEVMIGGASVGTYDEDQLGCSSTGGESFECTGTDLQLGGQSGVNLDSWDLLLDADPVVSGITALTNLNSSAQQFTLIFTLPTTVSPSSLMGGSIQGGMTDNNGDGVTLSAPTASALYTALIDNVSQQTLYADPSSFSAGSFLSGNVPNLAWGTPIPSAPGPAVTTDIKIQLDFTLTGNDSASLTSNFVVLPIPEPSTALMLGLGLAALGSRRRKA
jgi:hypothetical protein